MTQLGTIDERITSIHHDAKFHEEMSRKKRKELSSLLMEKHNVAPGMVVKTKFTGVTYRVASAYCHDNLSLSLICHRTYLNSKRPDASASSHQFLSGVDIVTPAPPLVCPNASPSVKHTVLDPNQRSSKRTYL